MKSHGSVSGIPLKKISPFQLATLVANCVDSFGEYKDSTSSRHCFLTGGDIELVITDPADSADSIEILVLIAAVRVLHTVVEADSRLTVHKITPGEWVERVQLEARQYPPRQSLTFGREGGV